MLKLNLLICGGYGMSVKCYRCHTVASKKDKKCKNCGAYIIKEVNPFVQKLVEVLGFCIYTIFGLGLMYQAIFEMKHLGNRVFFTLFGLFMVPSFYDVLGFIFPYVKIKTSRFSKILYIVLFACLAWFLTDEFSGGPSQIVNADPLNYEVVREGFRPLEKIQVFNIKPNIEESLEEFNLSYNNLEITPENKRFLLTIKTNVCDDFECSLDYFVRTTRAINTNDDVYPYVSDLNVVFMFNNEEYYILKYTNMYLKDDNYLEKDGVIINVKTDNMFLLEDFRKGLVDIESIPTNSDEVNEHKQYVMSWIKTFKLKINRIDDYQYELANKQFVRHFSATKEELNELSKLNEEATKMCEDLNSIDVPIDLKVLSYYIKRSCEFYNLGFELAVSGFVESDIDTILYSDESYVSAEYYLRIAESFK